MPTLMNILNSTWRGTRWVLLTCLLLLNGCSKKQIESVVIPDSHELRQAWDCPVDGAKCVPDPYRLTIDAGYLRDILRTLEGCTK